VIQDQGLNKAMGTWDPVSKDQECCAAVVNYVSLIMLL